MKSLIRKCALGTVLVAITTAASAVTFDIVLTGGTSGVYYPLGVTLSQLYGEMIPDSKVQVQATKASAENLNLLQAGRGEIGGQIPEMAGLLGTAGRHRRRIGEQHHRAVGREL